MKKTHTYIIGIMMLAIVFGPAISGAQGGLWTDGGGGNTSGQFSEDSTWGGPVDLGEDTTPPTPATDDTGPNGASVGAPAPRDTGSTGRSVRTGASRGEGDHLITNPLGENTTSLKQVVLNIVNIVQILLIMAAVLYLIYAGFMFVTARGESAKITKARNALLWGIIGLALVLGAQVIITAIESSVKGIFSK